MLCVVSLNCISLTEILVFYKNNKKIYYVPKMWLMIKIKNNNTFECKEMLDLVATLNAPTSSK